MAGTPPPKAANRKLFGRAFYESIGSPRVVLAPMVDQSEFAWRLLTRSFMPSESQKSLLSYTPMLHARMFVDTPKYRNHSIEPLRTPLPSPPPTSLPTDLDRQELYLDGHPQFDRPLFVQFCANQPDELLAAARYLQPFCDAVDLNLGCPQGIAKRGHYGAFLQEDQDLIYQLINRLHKDLAIPVTAKMRILDTKEKTLSYAKLLLDAGASIITVHGRQRDQKGHNTGVADWTVIRFLRDQLPSETVIFANGNILQHEDIQQCLEATRADAIMSAEGNLHDPSIFAKPPPVGEEGREYWRGKDGKGGYRMDAVFRRYLDIIYKHVLQQEPPRRRPLFVPEDVAKDATIDGDDQASNGNRKRDRDVSEEDAKTDGTGGAVEPPPTKKQKREELKHERKKQKQELRQKQNKKVEPVTSPNLKAMQAHLFQLLRPLCAKDHDVRNALARCRAGDLEAFENVLQLTEVAVRRGIMELEKSSTEEEASEVAKEQESKAMQDVSVSSLATVERCKRPYFVCQPWVRPLPEEAIAKGAMTVGKKTKTKEDGNKGGNSASDAHRDQAVQSERKIEAHKEALVNG